jgi:hypothetical protein
MLADLIPLTFGTDLIHTYIYILYIYIVTSRISLDFGIDVVSNMHCTSRSLLTYAI